MAKAADGSEPIQLLNTPSDITPGADTDSDPSVSAPVVATAFRVTHHMVGKQLKGEIFAPERDLTAEEMRRLLDVGAIAPVSLA